jgi:hypothetical protein
MGNAAKFLICILISAAFFLVLKFKFLDNYMTSDKDQASCEVDSSSNPSSDPSTDPSNDCKIWYNESSLCLKGNKDERGICRQKNALIPLGLIFGGLFFGLFSIVALFE